MTPLYVRKADMIRPKDLKDDEIWEMLCASRDGHLKRVKTLLSRRPDLVHCEYNYTPPMHFAVREGHADLVRYLVEQGADVANYRTYPFQDSLLTMAQDREHAEVVDILLDLAARRFPVDAGLAEFLEAVQSADVARVRQSLADNPQLARA